jgi:hypothetical protein
MGSLLVSSVGVKWSTCFIIVLPGWFDVGFYLVLNYACDVVLVIAHQITSSKQTKQYGFAPTDENGPQRVASALYVTLVWPHFLLRSISCSLLFYLLGFIVGTIHG